MIGLLGKILKVLIEENDKLNGIKILGFKICKDNIIRGNVHKRKKGQSLKFTSKNIN